MNTSIKKQISMLLDNELPQEQKQDLMQRANHDPKIEKMMRNEQDFRDFYKSNIKRPSVSPQIQENLRKTIF
jgi:hypothetical protein